MCDRVVPLVGSRGRIVMGGVIRTIGHRRRPTLAIPYTAMGRHQVVIGYDEKSPC